MDDLRQRLIRLANRKPELKPILSPLLKESAYGEFPKVFGWLDQRLLVVWTSYAGFGRAHHITGNVKAAEDLLERALSKFLTYADQQGISYETSEITHEATRKDPRTMVGAFHVRMVGDHSLDDLYTREMAKALGLSGFKQIPR